MTKTGISPEQHRRNVRTAWLVAAFALIMFLTSIPFWKGIFALATQSGL